MRTSLIRRIVVSYRKYTVVLYMYRGLCVCRMVHTEAKYSSRWTVSFISIYSQLQIHLTLLTLGKKCGVMNSFTFASWHMSNFVNRGHWGTMIENEISLPCFGVLLSSDSDYSFVLFCFCFQHLASWNTWPLYKRQLTSASTESGRTLLYDWPFSLYPT